jgi:hypothetical protein
LVDVISSGFGNTISLLLLRTEFQEPHSGLLEAKHTLPV